MPEETLVIRKERILEAAAGCSQAKAVLEKIFPEAFPKLLHFRCGSLFLIADHTSKPTKTVNFWVGDFRDSRISSSNLVMLIHTSISRQYRLVHLYNGYSFSKHIYKRDGAGIAIPEEDLKNLNLVPMHNLSGDMV